MRVDSGDKDAMKKWLDGQIGNGENGILVYPNVGTFRQLYGEYVRVAFTNDGGDGSLPRIILLAAFYETVDSVKHDLAGAGVDTRKYIDDGSLVIVDAFEGYYPDMAGMKKLVASL